MKFNIIGAGRLGKNIALNLRSAHLADLDSLCNKTFQSTLQAQKELAFGNAVASIKDLPPVDVTWITSNDDSIEPIVEHLVQSPHLKSGSFIIHCSGVLNSQILAPLKNQGCCIASFHPLKAFKAGDLHPKIFHQVHCVIEGDKEVCDWLMASFQALGARLITIQPEAKAMYHAAAVMASNYLVTLARSSEQLMQKAGIPNEHIRTMICNLMQGNIDNLRQSQTIAESLTGPLMRGDLKTLNVHMQAIDDEVIKNLYKTAALATLPIVQLPDDLKQIIVEMFQ